LTIPLKIVHWTMGNNHARVAILHFRPQADHRIVESLFAGNFRPAVASSRSVQPARSAVPAWRSPIPRSRQGPQSLWHTGHRFAALDHSFEGVPDSRMPNHPFCRNTAEHSPRSGSADYTSVGLIFSNGSLALARAPRGTQRDPMES
jgi:hypothetical protein